MRAGFRRRRCYTVALAVLIAGPAMAIARPASAVERVRTVPPAVEGDLRDGAGQPLPAPAVHPANAPAERGEVAVTVDRAKVIRLPERTQTLILGNPSIADVAIQKNGIAVVTGKSYGVTNVIALDGAGNMLAESTVSVSAPNDSVVVVQRGLERQSYSCTPSCQPAVVLGDANGFFSDTKGQADSHTQFSTQR